MRRCPLIARHLVLNGCPRAVSLRKNAVTCDVQWSEDKSTVTVDVKYAWTPEAFWAPITFRATTTVATIQ